MARPRKDEAIDIKARALTAAIEILREDPEGLSLAVLARRVGCSAPALYAHFEGKDDLLDQTRAAACAEMMEAKRQRFAGFDGDPCARLRAGGRDYVIFARDNPALYRLIFAPRHALAEQPDISFSDAVIAPLVAGVRAAQPSGFAAGAEASEVAQMMWFAVHGAIMMALDRQLPGPEAARWQRALATVDTVMALLAPNPGKE
ncbi:TetR/AcrR family transcriptional regulator [Frigidibacter sp.]|uniref:TetR/AcrR family transcriptional regulator n=1 Tax=Frigidibacter sp. TaxID=2586418 RepID=UPI002736A404|nr:TetR/AcrR family transcriptional regulator [Frigidibacter sp.]MDP3340213.1 WHG domain-containing protein [Frigidibacter sp.]